jgi:hypothetical protein
MKQTLCTLLTIGLLLCTVQAFAASGLQGRVAWRGELIEGVKVRAYRSIADIADDKVVAVSEPTSLDGTYQLELPPGNYVLTARNYEEQPKPGDLFCYYSGSPIQVVAGHLRNVGFNLIRIPEEAPQTAGKRSGIRGEISYQDEPLGRSYLYVYKDPSKGFKGPGYFIQPVEKGRFKLNLPPGDYYLLARKRLRGGQFGPIEIGDYFNYYYGNPVVISAGQVREIKIETITRLSMLEEGPEAPFAGVKGTVLKAGQPQSGMVVFAYRRAEMTGTPDHFSAATGADGQFVLALPDAGPYYLLARQGFGGPAEEGELYGRYAGPDGPAVKLDAEGKSAEVTIHVVPKTLP